jgi:hypothetical protein
MSDLALKMLAESDFSSGISHNPKIDFPVARKFGLRKSNENIQLHEFGIFYYDHDPYVLGVMTKGPREAELYPVLSGISDIILNEAISHSSTSNTASVN